jgi:sigma-E factor negative regulatory protein RseB
MIWLYWRRLRLGIAVAGITLAMLAALALLADRLAEPDSASTPQPAAARDPGAARPRFDLPSTDNALVRRGLLLMTAAVAACRSVSYRGIQIVAWSSRSGSSTYLIDVWHRAGQPQLAESDGDADDRAVSDRLPGPASHNTAAVGVLSISSAMLSLLRSNYVVEYAGTGSSSSRPARIVAVRRRDGTLAAQFWLDRDTGLPLRREMFDVSGRRVSEGAFIDLQIGLRTIGPMPPTEGQAWDTYVPATESMGGASRPLAARVAELRDDGWPVPRMLAGNMALAGVTRTATKSGPVLDASYSDGLSVVSLFIQRGELSGTLPGWHLARLHGLPVYATESGDVDEQGLAWSADDFVYTVIADAPPGSVEQVIVQLPHDRDIGFWERVRRGIRRMGSWFDPFG